MVSGDGGCIRSVGVDVTSPLEHVALLPPRQVRADVPGLPVDLPVDTGDGVIIRVRHYPTELGVIPSENVELHWEAAIVCAVPRRLDWRNGAARCAAVCTCSTALSGAENLVNGAFRQHQKRVPAGVASLVGIPLWHFEKLLQLLDRCRDVCFHPTPVHEALHGLRQLRGRDQAQFRIVFPKGLEHKAERGLQSFASIPGHDGNEVDQAGGNLVFGDRLRHLGKCGRQVPPNRIDLSVQDLHLSLEPAGLDSK
jgi:hypothetical protein